MRFDLAEIGVGHPPGGVGAHRFEDVLNGDVASGESSRRDRSAVEQDARNIEPRQRHGAAGIVLSQPTRTTRRIEQIAAR